MTDEEKIKNSLEEFLDKNWDALRHKYPNVINIGIGRKEVGGKETNELCLVFYVTKKVDLKMLSPKEIIPPTIESTCTDVQNLQSDFKMGETEPSKRPRYIQKKLAGGVKK
jgi:hypothetical protein